MLGLIVGIVAAIALFLWALIRISKPKPPL